MHDAYEARPKLHSPNASAVPSFQTPKRGKVRGGYLGTWNCIIKILIDALPGAIWTYKLFRTKRLRHFLREIPNVLERPNNLACLDMFHSRGI